MDDRDERPETPESKEPEVSAALSSEMDAPLPPRAEKIAAEGRGVVLYLRQREHNLDLIHQLKTYDLMQEKGMSAQEASIVTGYGINRDYGVGAQILHDLGLRRILLLSNHPPRVAALEGFGLEVIGHVPLGMPAAEKETADTRRLNATLRSDDATVE